MSTPTIYRITDRQPSADVERVAEEIEFACGKCASGPAKLRAILTRFATELTVPKDAEIERLNKALSGEEERAGIEISRRGEAEKRVERAEAELAARKASADADFELFHAMRMKLTAACGDPYKLSDEALDAIIAERDQLRAEVERLNAPRSTLRSPADIKEIADLRAQLTAAQEDLEHLLAGVSNYLCVHDAKRGEDYDGSLAPLRVAFNVVAARKKTQ